MRMSRYHILALVLALAQVLSGGALVHADTQALAQGRGHTHLAWEHHGHCDHTDQQSTSSQESEEESDKEGLRQNVSTHHHFGCVQSSQDFCPSDPCTQNPEVLVDDGCLSALVQVSLRQTANTVPVAWRATARGSPPSSLWLRTNRLRL